MLKAEINLNKTLLEKSHAFDPRGRVALTPENVFILTP